MTADEIAQTADVAAVGDFGPDSVFALFYQRQDGVLDDNAAVRNGVRNAMEWLVTKGYRNVVVEIANEYGHGGFNHSLLRHPEGQVELIELARSVAPNIFVSTSGLGGGTIQESVAEASDFMLIHFNHPPLEAIPDRIQRPKHLGPVLSAALVFPGSLYWRCIACRHRRALAAR